MESLVAVNLVKHTALQYLRDLLSPYEHDSEDSEKKQEALRKASIDSQFFSILYQTDHLLTKPFKNLYLGLKLKNTSEE